MFLIDRTLQVRFWFPRRGPVLVVDRFPVIAIAIGTGEIDRRDWLTATRRQQAWIAAPSVPRVERRLKVPAGATSSLPAHSPGADLPFDARPRSCTDSHQTQFRRSAGFVNLRGKCAGFGPECRFGSIACRSFRPTVFSASRPRYSSAAAGGDCSSPGWPSHGVSGPPSRRMNVLGVADSAGATAGGVSARARGSGRAGRVAGRGVG